MEDIFAKSKRKWTDEQIDRADDLASRMMASKDWDGDWSKAFAISRWMENRGYDVKKKPSKPHKEYIPKKKKNADGTDAEPMKDATAQDDTEKGIVGRAAGAIAATPFLPAGVAAGAATGAVSGAIIGTKVGGVKGGLAGAGLGAIAGGVGGAASALATGAAVGSRAQDAINPRKDATADDDTQKATDALPTEAPEDFIKGVVETLSELTDLSEAEIVDVAKAAWSEIAAEQTEKAMKSKVAGKEDDIEKKPKVK